MYEDTGCKNSILDMNFFSHTKNGTISFFYNLTTGLGLFSHRKGVNCYPNISHVENMIYIRKFTIVYILDQIFYF